LLSTHKSHIDLEDLIYNECGFKTWQFTFFDYAKVLNLHQDSLRDYTPKTGHYNLRFNDADKIILRKSNVNSWVINVPVEEIRQLVTRFPKDLFRKNIRNFLGTSKANRAIRSTLKDDPDNFWYYNNGITILCDQANLVLEESHIRLVNPQVVNGCQTVTSIKNYKGELNGDILVRIIQSDDHAFIQSITLAQNTSNPVKARDFKSNDPIQIRLKRELKKKRYYYEIKRGEEFSSMKKKYRSVNAEFDYSINNEKIAKFLATELIEPGTALGKGSEVFFDTLYDKLFTPTTSSSDIITAWSLDRIIRFSYKGETDSFFEYERPHVFKNRAKYYVLKLIYDALRQSDIRQWKKKWAIDWNEPPNSEWYSFQKKFIRIAESCFKLIYRAWKKKKDPNLNNYLQAAGTLDELRLFQKGRWNKLLEKTQEIFVKLLITK
ncbi:MAG: AIPR family protein, partial [Candidatus Kariarchaeaceae archaeon]